jgi:hypothetical protein
MSVFAGSFTPTAEGFFSITTPFLPDEVELFLAARTTSNPETDQGRYGSGFATDSYQSCEAVLINSNGQFSASYRNNNNICLVGLGTPAGQLTNVLEIKHVDFEDEGGGVFKWNFEVSNWQSSTYNLQVSAKFRA